MNRRDGQDDGTPIVPAAAPVDANNSASSKPGQHFTIPFVSQWLDSAHNSLQRAGDRFQNDMSPWAKNHSGSIIAASHLIGEGFMLKSGGLKFLENNREAGRPVNYLLDPAYNVVLSIVGKGEGGRGINDWQTRSTMCGTTAWMIGLLTPDAKPDAEFDRRENEKLAGKSQAAIAVIHMKEGLHLFSPHYKRETLGLGIIGAGLLSAVAGSKNLVAAGGMVDPYLDRWKMGGGLITALAGLQLEMKKDDRDAWASYGVTKWARIPFALNSGLLKRSKAKALAEATNVAEDPSWKHYFVGTAQLQASGILSTLIGGGEKQANALPALPEALPPPANNNFLGVVAGTAHLPEEFPTSRIESPSRASPAFPKEVEGRKIASLG